MDVISYFMENPDRNIEPFQVWLNDCCIWADDNQPILFSILLCFVAIFSLIIFFTKGFSIGVLIVWAYLALAATTGYLAVRKNRQIWAWGLLFSWLIVPIIVLVCLPSLCANCLHCFPRANLNNICPHCGNEGSWRYRAVYKNGSH